MTPRLRLRAVFALCLVTPLFACGGGDNDTPQTWVVMGSSSAAGVGASPGHGWADQLAAALPGRRVATVNIARGGALTYQALPTASTPPVGRPAPDPTINTDRALAQLPRVVLLSYPSNDVVAGYGAVETAGNQVAMRDTLRAGGATVMALGTQPRDALGAAQRAVQADVDTRLQAAFGPCFVPLQAALADAAGRIAPAYSAGDGIHLNDSGHARVLQQVRAALDSGRCVAPN